MNITVSTQLLHLKQHTQFWFLFTWFILSELLQVSKGDLWGLPKRLPANHDTGYINRNTNGSLWLVIRNS